MIINNKFFTKIKSLVKIPAETLGINKAFKDSVDLQPPNNLKFIELIPNGIDSKLNVN